MRADDWMVDYLYRHGVTDVFGIPGVVVMDFLYAVDRRKPAITPHLSYHEQGAAFAACGYAQSTGKMGVAYATRGPGFTNMLTAIADAYYDSIPVMFITAHSTPDLEKNMRVMNNQEIDTVELAKNITKKSVRIDNIDEFQKEIIDSYKAATTGRKGPVFLDVFNALFSKEVGDVCEETGSGATVDNMTRENTGDEFRATIENCLKESKRPVILIGNGVRDGENAKRLTEISLKYKIPILSSRGAQDIVSRARFYYGFVGSRATRYSNFILSKTDLIIAVGNRFSFPIKSKSFLPAIEDTKIIRVDIDETEFLRDVPNSTTFKMYSADALAIMEKAEMYYSGADDWITICDYLREKLDNWDSNIVIQKIMEIINCSDKATPIICDVGNHSFWVTTAHTYMQAANRIMYSGSFGTLGSALPKAIGASYSTKKPAICFTGDQGVQFNIQELQFIAIHNVPVTIVILNNSSSGMIMEREIAIYGDHLVHTTLDSGYSFPEFRKVAECYGLSYYRIDLNNKSNFIIENDYSKPRIIEIMIDKNTALEPSLPIGRECQDLSPDLPRELYNELNEL